jgi:ATP-dependent Lon protease
VRVEPDAVVRLIREWTREAGVRELERQLAALHRKLARRVVEGVPVPATLRADALGDLLGPPRHLPDAEEHVHDPGVVTGVAWTAAGGELLLIEATRLPGKQGLKLTGSLGDVMKESAEAAWSWLRGHAADYGLTAEQLDAEIHLHVPAGAIPKDGPSAGVTMVTALASLLLRLPVRERLAMTGEITLRGRVLPVGGVKEKALAARRAGVRTLLLPRANLVDLEELPAEVKADLTFQVVDRTEEVLFHALGLPVPERAAPPRPDPARERGKATRPPRPRRPTAPARADGGA